MMIRSQSTLAMNKTLATADRLYRLVTGGTAVLLIAWRVYWMNRHQVGAHSYSAFALPLAVMTLVIGFAVLLMLSEYGSKRNQRIATSLILLVSIVVTQPWEMMAHP